MQNGWYTAQPANRKRNHPSYLRTTANAPAQPSATPAKATARTIIPNVIIPSHAHHRYCPALAICDPAPT